MCRSHTLSNNPFASLAIALFLAASNGESPINVGAFAVTSAWDESAVTWNSFPTAQTTGFSAQIDGAAGRYKEWNVTHIARSWQSGPNYGLYLRGPVDGTQFERIFEAREWNERVPRLVITYHFCYSLSLTHSGSGSDPLAASATVGGG